MLDCGDVQEYCLREVAMHVTSYHFERAPNYNENNAGVGLKWRRGEADGTLFVTLGTFRNSLARSSTYSGIGSDWHLTGPVKLRLTAGLVTGYDIPLAPFVFPELLVGRKSGVALGYAPKIQLGEQLLDSFVSLTLFRRF
jgi:hypothetical protein